jgi:hypothetical protein
LFKPTIMPDFSVRSFAILTDVGDDSKGLRWCRWVVEEVVPKMSFDCNCSRKSSGAKPQVKMWERPILCVTKEGKCHG